MTLVRAQVIKEMASPMPTDRPGKSISGVQIVSRGKVIWAKKVSWLRCPPFTVGPFAHDGQIQVRLKFSSLAKEAAARRETARDSAVNVKYGLVGAAGYIKEHMPGYTAPARLVPEKYPSRIRRTAYTAAELRTIAEAREVAVP